MGVSAAVTAEVTVLHGAGVQSHRREWLGRRKSKSGVLMVMNTLLLAIRNIQALVRGSAGHFFEIHPHLSVGTKSMVQYTHTSVLAMNTCNGYCSVIGAFNETAFP